MVLQSILQYIAESPAAAAADKQLRAMLISDYNDKIKHLNKLYTEARRLDDAEMIKKVKTALAKIAAKRSEMLQTSTGFREGWDSVVEESGLAS